MEPKQQSNKKFSIKDIDFLGSNVQFLFKDSKHIKTIFGGGVTIILGIILVVLIVIFGIEMITKSNTKMTVNSVRRNYSDVFLKEFPVSFVLLDFNGTPLKNADKFVTLKSNQFNTYLNNTTEEIELAIVKCQPEHFGEYYYLVKGSFHEEYLFCIDFYDDSVFSNDFGSANSSLVEIWVFQCDEARDNKLCASKEEREKTLSNIYITFNFVDSYIDATNYKTPVNIYLRQAFQHIGLEFFRGSLANFVKSEIHTDNGLFWESMVVTSTHQYRNEKLDVSPKGFLPGQIYIMSLESQRIGNKIIRTYLKIPELLSNVGGFMNILLVVGTIICKFVTETSFYLQIAKEMVTFEEEPYEDEFAIKNQQNKTQILDFVRTANNPGIEEEERAKSFSVDRLQLNITKNPSKLIVLKEIAVLKDEKLKSDMQNLQSKVKERGVSKEKLGFFSYLKLLMCYNEKLAGDQLLYDSVLLFFREKMNITFLLKKLYEVELINYILLPQKLQEHENNAQNSSLNILNVKIPLSQVIIDYCSKRSLENDNKISESLKENYNNITQGKKIEFINKMKMLVSKLTSEKDRDENINH